MRIGQWRVASSWTEYVPQLKGREPAPTVFATTPERFDKHDAALSFAMSETERRAGNPVVSDLVVTVVSVEDRTHRQKIVHKFRSDDGMHKRWSLLNGELLQHDWATGRKIEDTFAEREAKKLSDA